MARNQHICLHLVILWSIVSEIHQIWYTFAVDRLCAVPSWTIKHRNAHKNKNDHQYYVFLNLVLYFCSNLGLRWNLYLTITWLVFYIFVCLIELGFFRHHHVFCYIACLVFSFFLFLSAVLFDVLEYDNIINMLFIFSWNRFIWVSFIDDNNFTWNNFTWITIWSFYNIVLFSKG